MSNIISECDSGSALLVLLWKERVPRLGVVCRHPFAVKLLASVTASPLVKTCNFSEPQPFSWSATRRPLPNPAVPYDLFPHHWQHHRFGHACLLPLWMLWSSLKPVLLSLSFFLFFTYISAGLLKVFCVWGTGWRWSVCYRQWVKRGDRGIAIGAASLEWCLAHAMGRANFWASWCSAVDACSRNSCCGLGVSWCDVQHIQ